LQGKHGVDIGSPASLYARKTNIKENQYPSYCGYWVFVLDKNGSKTMLRFYLEVARTAFRRQLIYRWANLAGLLTNAFFGSIFSYVIIALYHARPNVAGYDLQDSLQYTWLVQSMIMTVLTFGWYDLMMTIRTGEVVTDLSKPCDFYWYWFSREAGRSVYYFLFRSIPTYALGMLLFQIGLPGNWHVWPLYLLALTLGTMMGIAYRFFYNLVAFWIIEARSVGLLAVTVALFFTGSYIPIPFLPTWLRAIVDWLPFSNLINVPVEILLGKLGGDLLALTIARQALWLLALTLTVRGLTAVAARHVIVQGG
jgi:ABC-2 type transport system permease protein